ncbi:Inositolphosphorylceramide synthase subunit Kei1-domain-containing protein [Ganoderma leucocontextum]|nr:Inositolphosphorylceramide synthase subunit Kei1-domain-containing protein [Ganoderma leucocontextum]
MKLTLRPEWRLRPLSTFLGFLDIKTGVTIALLFAFLNKVAGVYGLVAVLTGAGGSLAQLSLYIYSVIGLVALVWGLKAILHEDPKQTLYFAHLFFADHILSSAWLVFFAVLWWYTPHDGTVQIHSDAQKAVQESGPGHNMTAEERAEAAMTLWHAEKGLATAMIIMGWILKIYFAALLYSYAIHLRKGSYRSLPHSQSYLPNGTANGGAYSTSALPDEDDDDVEEFYRLPVRTPTSAHPPPQNGSARGGHTPTSSLSSFTDFVSAPGRARRGKPGRSNLNISASANDGAGAGDEVIFDEDMSDGAGSKDGKTEDRRPLMSASRPSSSSHSRRASRSRD